MICQILIRNLPTCLTAIRIKTTARTMRGTITGNELQRDEERSPV
jgi:hypothetical protein